MENCWEEPPQSSQDYYPHYNLFQSSIFYDTDNFRIAYLTYKYDDSLTAESGIRTSESQESNAEHDDCHTESGTKCSEDLARSAEPPDKESDEENVEPELEKRIVTKGELYNDPDLFLIRRENVDPSPAEPAYLGKTKPWGYDWTRQSWVKGRGKRIVMNRRVELKEERREESRGERREERRAVRDKGLCPLLVDAPRVQNSVAENMMQRMGWLGGALGKVSDGVLRPVTKDPNYASRNVGLGHCVPDAARAPPARQLGMLTSRDVFRTNVLQFILEFVKDDTEIQLRFDTSLRQCERRHIQTVVTHIIREGNIAVLSSVAQYDLAQGILARNQYLLTAVGEGDPTARYISIYKEAPPHVYLVTPDDFLPKENDDELTETEHTCETHMENASENDDNPFLRSIQKSLKKDDEPNVCNKFQKDCNIAKVPVKVRAESTPEGKILEFFLEFAEFDFYKEFWFLGKFDAKQVQVINDLLNDVSACIEDLDSFEGDEEMAKVFRSGDVRFELKEGSNGTAEIHKVSAKSSSED